MAEDPTYLKSFIEKSCSLTTYSNISSGTLLSTSIFSSNIKDTIDVFLYYNNTYSEYQKIALTNTEDALCPLNDRWTDWMSRELQRIYKKICNSNPPQDYCRKSYNTHVSEDIISLFKSLDSICPLFTPTPYTNSNSNGDITHMIPTVPQNDRFAYYKQRVDALKNKTAEITAQMSLFSNNTIFLRNENNALKIELQQVKDERDNLRQEVFKLEVDKQLLTYRIKELEANLTRVQTSEQELQVQLNDTTLKLQKANESTYILAGVLEKLKHNISGISDKKDAFNYFNAQQENYTNYLNIYVEDKESTGNSLRHTQDNIKTYEQDIERLQSQLQDKTIELDNTYALLNNTLSHIDRIHNVVMVNNSTQGTETHEMGKRNINTPYNEAQDDYAVSKQIMEPSYEERVADSERKVEEILTIFASLEKENEILKSIIYQNEENEENEESINYNKNQGGLMPRHETTDNYDAIIKQAKEHADYIMKRLQPNNYNKSLNVPPDDYPAKVNSTNKFIDSPEVNSYSITIGSIAFGAVVLYLTNKYCFPITKWPIMFYKYIVKSCGISDTNVKDNSTELTNVIENEEDNIDDSFSETEYRSSFESNSSKGVKYDNLERVPINRPIKEKEGYLVPNKFVTFAQNTQITTFDPTLDSNSGDNHTYQNSSKEEHLYDVPVHDVPVPISNAIFDVSGSTLIQGASSPIAADYQGG